MGGQKQLSINSTDFLGRCKGGKTDVNRKVDISDISLFLREVDLIAEAQCHSLWKEKIYYNTQIENRNIKNNVKIGKTFSHSLFLPISTLNYYFNIKL